MYKILKIRVTYTVEGKEVNEVFVFKNVTEAEAKAHCVSIVDKFGGTVKKIKSTYTR